MFVFVVAFFLMAGGEVNSADSDLVVVAAVVVVAAADVEAALLLGWHWLRLEQVCLATLFFFVGGSCSDEATLVRFLFELRSVFFV